MRNKKRKNNQKCEMKMKLKTYHKNLKLQLINEEEKLLKSELR